MKKVLITTVLVGIAMLPLSTLANLNATNPCVPNSHMCSTAVGGSITVGQDKLKSDDVISFSGNVIVGDTYICKTSAFTQGAMGNFVAKNYSQVGGSIIGSPVILTGDTLFMVVAATTGNIEVAIKTSGVYSSNEQGPQLTIQCLETASKRR